jgi:hypothetical protein
MIEERGSIERGAAAALGVEAGGCARTCGSLNFSVEPWSAVIETWRGNVLEDMDLKERVYGFVFLKSMALFVGTAIVSEMAAGAAQPGGLGWQLRMGE